MRQKKIKDATIENLMRLGVLVAPKEIQVEEGQQVMMEIGSGKGQFISNLAKDYPDILFIAVEKDKNACYRLAQRKDIMELNNLIVILDDAQNLLSYMGETRADVVQLNFSDPWPKAKHHKRRLTYPSKIKLYQSFLKDSGKIIFRTDHVDFFNDSFTYFAEANCEIKECNWNLEPSKYMTEYEEKKRELGPIYQLVAVRKHD